jgi:hypothetical protein
MLFNSGFVDENSTVPKYMISSDEKLRSLIIDVESSEFEIHFFESKLDKLCGNMPFPRQAYRCVVECKVNGKTTLAEEHEPFFPNTICVVNELLWLYTYMKEKNAQKRKTLFDYKSKK